MYIIKTPRGRVIETVADLDVARELIDGTRNVIEYSKEAIQKYERENHHRNVVGDKKLNKNKPAFIVCDPDGNPLQTFIDVDKARAALTGANYIQYNRAAIEQYAAERGLKVSLKVA